VVISGDVDADQRRLAEVLKPYIELGCFCVVFGGGHETSYGHFLGYARAGRTVEIVNWDAHANVRDLDAVAVGWLLRGRSERR
jgi:formiminoglutamase